MSKAKKIILRAKEYIKHLNICDLNVLLKNKIVLLAGIFIIFVLFILIFQRTITSREELIKDLQVALKENKVNKIYDEINFNNKSIGKKELEPLMRYYKDDSSRIDSTINELKNQGKDNIFTIKKDKKLFWEDYYLELKPVSLKVNINIKNTKLYLDDKLLEDDVAKNIVPGKHEIKGELHTPYGNVEKKKELLLMTDEEIKLELDAFNITVSSNFNDADVYINGKSIGKKVSEAKEIGPIPINADVKVSLQKEFPWGTVKSEEVKVGNIPNVYIKMDIANHKLINDIKNISQEFYTSVFKALNSGNPDIILFANKDAKNKIYSDIKKKAFFFKNNYQISELATELESSEFAFEDNSYKAHIVVKVKYDIYKKLLPFVKEQHEIMFLTNMKYVGNEWLVEDAQKFNL